MKRVFYLLIFLYPIVVCAQQPWLKSSPEDYIWKYIGPPGFTEEQAIHMSMDLNPLTGQPYVAYADPDYSNKITVMKFDGTTWINVGNKGFSESLVAGTSIAFDTLGQPYVAFSEEDLNDRITVMKYDGSGWEYVGTRGFTLGESDYLCLTISPDGKPYVAYTDWYPINNGKLSLMKFDAGVWQYIGGPGFTEGVAFYPSLKFNPLGQPLVAFQNHWLDFKASLLIFNGISWEYVGQPGFSADQVQYPDLSFSQAGEPYVAFTDFANSGKVTIMKYNGSEWDTIGNPGLSPGLAGYSKIAFNSWGQLYIAYYDGNVGGKATVMKYEDPQWNFVGSEGFSSGIINNLYLAISPTNKLVVSYCDGNYDNGACVMEYDSLFVGVRESVIFQLSICPNPAKDNITIETSAIQTKSQLSILNLNGQQLLTRQITEPKTQINISTLPDGVYFVRLTNDRTVTVGKIIKQ